MSKNVVIMGGAGTSGQRIARRLAASGIPLTLAGRHKESLAPLASELAAEAIEADIAAPQAVLAGARMVVNTVGPFATHAGPLARACLDAGIPYLDIANELSAVTQLLALADQAKEKGVVVVTGAGFGPSVSEAMVARLMSGAGGPAAAVRVALAPSGEAMSPGVQASVALASAEGAAWYADGALQRAPIGTGATLMRFGGHSWQVIPAPVADLEAARLATGAPDITAYFTVPGERPDPGQTSYAYAEVHDQDGGRHASVATLGTGMDVTAAIAAETVSRILAGYPGAGAGAWTPGTLYGPGLVPGHWGNLTATLEAIGRSVSDIAAVLITHAHIDHLGLATRVQKASGAEIWVGPGDEQLAAEPMKIGKHSPGQRPLLRYVARRPAGLGTPLHLVRMGGTRTPPVIRPRHFTNREQLDVPGRLIPIATPGHTPGSTTFLLPTGAAAFTGDSLVTEDSVYGHVGPCLVCLAFTNDGAAAMRSLGQFTDADAETVLPGHGDPWPGGLGSAVRTALDRGLR
jgi:glyoxylase-like metal-dependent hydrolase (beta-lactamase superfamily II)